MPAAMLDFGFYKVSTLLIMLSLIMGYFCCDVVFGY